MKKEVGLWIDHHKAVIVTIQDEVEVTLEIRSNVGKHVRFSSGTQSKSPDSRKGATAEDMRDRQFGDLLNSYYDGIVAMIHGAESIWIFGPGEAKGELVKRLKQAGLEERIVGVESVDKMTDHQIAAKIRDRYIH